MHDPVSVSVAECASHLGDDLADLRHRQLTLARQATPQSLAFHQRHGVVKKASGMPRGEEWNYVRMLQIGGDLDLAVEPVRTDSRGQLRREDLDYDPAAQGGLPSHEDPGHAPRHRAHARLRRLNPALFGDRPVDSALSMKWVRPIPAPADRNPPAPVRG